MWTQAAGSRSGSRKVTATAAPAPHSRNTSSAGSAATSGAVTVGARRLRQQHRHREPAQYPRVTRRPEQRQGQGAPVDRHDAVAHAVQQRKAGCRVRPTQQQQRGTEGKQQRADPGLDQQVDAGADDILEDAAGDLAGADQRGDADRFGFGQMDPLEQGQDMDRDGRGDEPAEREEGAQQRRAPAAAPGIVAWRRTRRPGAAEAGRAAPAARPSAG